jgi:hypothetical protein
MPKLAASAIASDDSATRIFFMVTSAQLTDAAHSPFEFRDLFHIEKSRPFRHYGSVRSAKRNMTLRTRWRTDALAA